MSANQIDEYRKALRATADALRPGYISVAELAKRLEVSRQTAYNRIEALKALCTVAERLDAIGGPRRRKKIGQKVMTYRVTAGVVP